MLRFVVLALLAVDGVISAIVGAVFLQIRVGSVPFPISALVSGLLNALLVWAALVWAPSLRVAALPLWTFLFALAAMALSGPGGDIVFGGSGFDQWGSAVLLVLGAAPAGAVLWRRRQAGGLR